MVLQSFTENLMTYALGRRIEAADMPTVRAIVRAAAKQDYKISAFITGVIASPAFQMRSSTRKIEAGDEPSPSDADEPIADG